jgi:hypothetical protein
VSQTNARIHQLAPVLNSGFAAGYLTSTHNNLNTRVSYYDGKLYLFAAPRQNGTTNVTFQTLSATSVNVMFESRSITPSGNGFSDSFANGNTVHIYEITP